MHNLQSRKLSIIFTIVTALSSCSLHCNQTSIQNTPSIWDEIKSDMLSFIHWSIILAPLQTAASKVEKVRILHITGALGSSPVDQKCEAMVRMLAQQTGYHHAQTMEIKALNNELATGLYDSVLVINPPYTTMVYINLKLFSSLPEKAIKNMILEHFSGEFRPWSATNLNFACASTCISFALAQVTKETCSFLQSRMNHDGFFATALGSIKNIANFCLTQSFITALIHDIASERHAQVKFKEFVKSYADKEQLKITLQEEYEKTGEIQPLQKLNIVNEIEQEDAQKKEPTGAKRCI